MNYKTLPLCLGFLLSVVTTSVWAQTAPVAEEKVLPTEISEPPYEVGDLVREQGYYIERGEGLPKINLRIINNNLRLYWIDSDGLIAEPEAKSATVRFQGLKRGLAYHSLSPMSDDAGLGAASLVPLKHVFNVKLSIGPEDQLSLYSFRYMPAMDVAKDPVIPKSE